MPSGVLRRKVSTRRGTLLLHTQYWTWLFNRYFTLCIGFSTGLFKHPPKSQAQRCTWRPKNYACYENLVIVKVLLVTHTVPNPRSRTPTVQDGTSHQSTRHLCAFHERCTSIAFPTTLAFFKIVPRWLFSPPFARFLWHCTLNRKNMKI